MNTFAAPAEKGVDRPQVTTRAARANAEQTAFSDAGYVPANANLNRKSSVRAQLQMKDALNLSARAQTQTHWAETLNAAHTARQPAALQMKSVSGNHAAQLSSGATTDAPVQRKESNRTGLPDALKAGLENLSGLAMDDVRVHYNSPEPAAVQALAYTQGSEIHVAPGQEQHLAHEAWHVAQQKQGRVQPTRELAGGVPLNDAPALEREADEMGARLDRS